MGRGEGDERERERDWLSVSFSLPSGEKLQKTD